MTRTEEIILSEGFLADVRDLLLRSRAALDELERLGDEHAPEGSGPSPQVALEEIDAALTRLDEGTFGLCTDCRQLIPAERIEAMPCAGLCVRCQHGRETRAF